MANRLIVNADDFGRTRGVSGGIVRAHLDGIVTSTTVMMNLPGAAHDLQQAQPHTPRLGWGVHLNFTLGRPLLPPEWVRSLVDEHGRFHSQDSVMRHADQLDLAELRSELKAQVAAFKNAAGRAPDHLDAHHFAHVHPRLFAVYLDLADEYHLPVRIPFPRDEAGLQQLPEILGGLPRDLVLPILRADIELLRDRALRTTDRCVLDFFGTGVSVERLLQFIETLPEGVTELMTHPGVADEQLRAESAYGTQREAELAALTDPRVLARIQQCGVDLITFADLH